MKRNLSFILFLWIMFLSNFGNRSIAQFSVNVSTNYAQIVDSLIDSGVNISNVSYTGSPSACGYFLDGDSANLGVNSGIVLTTGFAADVDNGAMYSGSSTLGTSGDTLLQALAGGTTYDAAILVIDLIPEFNVLSLNGIFGSEDYPEYVGGNPSFLDYVGIFITGPNPAGGNYSNENIALLPGTSLPLLVNNVNAGANSQYFVNNTTGSIMFDGLTTVLQFSASVVPNANYRIIIAIGDGGDDIGDSGFFLAANSLKSENVSTGILEKEDYEPLVFYPNPTNHVIFATCENGYQILSTTGQLILSSETSTESIDISALPAGLYLLKTGNKIGRFVKTK